MVVMTVVTMVMMAATIGTGFWLKRRMLLGDSSAQTYQHLAQYSVFMDAQPSIADLCLCMAIP